ncbi:TetR/AcrR family transcriptional regulator [Williamsia sterculiae]|uniref:Transcriptional regulator, TetR family n=1 Tax=Williamsia sterculiae TaxID=1344003 RepID=A0A1N7CHU3_9NOCA|nr:TetR/AcrR family transcriptional regulator [Williamsia sterculiae]SIR63145.1 transcriptional regulator, TetR family [Williamsia sterculiae]
MRRTPATEVRSALLAAAQEVLARDGVRGVTVRTVATEAGVAPMGVYNHFESKDGLIEAIADDGYVQLRALMRDIGIQDARQRLREGGRRYRRFALQNPPLYRLMFSGQCEVNEEAAYAAFTALSDLVEYGHAAGVIRDDDIPLQTMQIWSTVHGAVSLELDQAGPPGMFDSELVYESVLDLIERGVAPGPS